MRRILAATITLGSLACSATAATLGAPTITTSIGEIRRIEEILNPYGFPDFITISYAGFIESTVGLPGLVGDSLSFSVLYSQLGPSVMSFKIDDQQLLTNFGYDQDFYIRPPIASTIDNGDGTFTYQYIDDFAAFGPQTSDDPAVKLSFDIQNIAGGLGRMHFQTVGGTPLPPAPVPLSAGGLFLLAGLGAFAALRNRRKLNVAL